MKRQRFQAGQVWLRRGKRGEKWYLRYRDDAGHKRLEVLGARETLPSRAAARARAAEFLAPLNGGAAAVPATVGQLIARYRTEELPQRPSTRASYASLLGRHIEPRWGAQRMGDVRPAAVEQWLRGLPLAPKTKANLRQLMHVLFECARRWELCAQNPVSLVRQSARRTKTLPRLSIEQYRQVLRLAVEPHRTMLLLAGALGLRIGEILGLQWHDVDFSAGTLTVRRDAKILRPLGLQVGIERLGWHAFRHMFAAALNVVGADAQTNQELMGHADRRTTEQYMYAFDDRKRAAVTNVAALLM